ncbi:MAG: DUF4126 domain-containing protein [Psychrobacter sp.]|nr:DUF4126 domain-containing protein [Psychrobacter sp.]
MTTTLLSIFLGIGLAASAGFRVFVPLFALSLAAYYGILPLNDSFAWVASTPALIVLAVASIVESISYLVPLVDNLLDTIAVPLAGIAGTMVMAASVADLSPEMTWALAIIAGGGAAATIKGTAATGRAISTGTTGGLANPVLSVGETGTAIGLSALSIFLPVIAAIVSVLVLLGIIWLVMRLRAKVSRP